MWVDHMVDHFSTYIYQKRGFYYFSKRIPKQLQPHHGKRRIVFALNTRSRAKAMKYAQVICQRLDERWLPMRLDAMGLGNELANDVTSSDAPKLSEAIQGYLQLKGMSIKSVKLTLCLLAPKLVHGIKSLRFILLEFVPQF